MLYVLYDGRIVKHFHATVAITTVNLQTDLKTCIEMKKIIQWEVGVQRD